MMDLDEAIKYFEEMVEIGETYEINKGMLEEYRQFAEWLKELKAYKEQSGDAISRKAVIDIINFEDKWLLDAKGHNADTGIAFSGMKSRIADLPSVTPQQRTGRWINSHIPESTLCECSACGFTCGAYSFNYCPNCGAKMEVSGCTKNI